MGSGPVAESVCAGRAGGRASAASMTNGLRMNHFPTMDLGICNRRILQNGCELAGEAGHDVFAIERLLEAHDFIDAVGAVDPDQAASGIDVVCQASAKLQRNTTVAQTGWLADDEDAAHELGVLVGNLQQFIRGQDRGRHAENVGGLAGHGKPSWCESINGASTRSTATKVHWQTRSFKGN